MYIAFKTPRQSLSYYYSLLFYLLLGTTTLYAARANAPTRLFGLSIELPLQNSYNPKQGSVLQQFYLDGGRITFTQPLPAKVAPQSTTSSYYQLCRDKMRSWLITKKEVLKPAVEAQYQTIKWLLTQYAAGESPDKLSRLITDPLFFSARQEEIGQLREMSEVINDRPPLDQLNWRFTKNMAIDLLALTTIEHPSLLLALGLKSMGLMLINLFFVIIDYPGRIKRVKERRLLRESLITLKYSFAEDLYPLRSSHPLTFIALFFTPNLLGLLWEAIERSQVDKSVINPFIYNAEKLANISQWEREIAPLFLNKSEKAAVGTHLLAHQVRDQELPTTIVDLIMAHTYSKDAKAPQLAARLAPNPITKPALPSLVANIIICSILYALSALYLTLTAKPSPSTQPLEAVDKSLLLIKFLAFSILVYLFNKGESRAERYQALPQCCYHISTLFVLSLFYPYTYLLYLYLPKTLLMADSIDIFLS